LHCCINISGRIKRKQRDPKQGVSSASTIQLDITAVDQRTVDSVKRQLQQLVDGMGADPVEIVDRLIAEMNSECRQEIQSLESATTVDITIGL